MRRAYTFLFKLRLVENKYYVRDRNEQLIKQDNSNEINRKQDRD